MKFELMKNEHGAVITHVALALSGIEREDAAQLIVSPQMALILKDKMSVKEIMTAISSMVMVVGNLAHRLVEMCEPQCETCDYDCISELLNSAVDSACIKDIHQVLVELYEVFDFCAVEEAAHYYENWQY